MHPVRTRPLMYTDAKHDASSVKQARLQRTAARSSERMRTASLARVAHRLPAGTARGQEQPRGKSLPRVRTESSLSFFEATVPEKVHGINREVEQLTAA